jgi:hypothetical protein
MIAGAIVGASGGPARAVPEPEPEHACLSGIPNPGPEDVCPLPRVSIWASPQTVAAGATTTLQWSTENAWSCWASAGPWAGAKGSVSSEVVGPINSATTFSLTCSNDTGTDTGSTTVEVSSPPPPPCCDPPPSPPPAPTGSVVTLPATNITTETAVLHGTVNPGGLDTGAAWQGQYNDPAFSAPRTDRVIPVGAGTVAVPVDTTAHGLDPAAYGLSRNNPWYFRLCATNAAGTTCGGTVAFCMAGATACNYAPLPPPCLSGAQSAVVDQSPSIGVVSIEDSFSIRVVGIGGSASGNDDSSSAQASSGDSVGVTTDCTPPPPPPPSCGGTVVLYEHVNFGGRCWTFGVGETAYVGDAATDQASSITVADGYTATLFTDANYGGGWVNTVTSGDPSGWSDVGNDSASSLVVQPTAPDSNYDQGSQVQTETFPDRFLLVSNGCARAGDGLGWKSLVRSREWTLALRVSFCWNEKKITKLWAREVVATTNRLPFPLYYVQAWESSFNLQAGEEGYASTVVRVDATFKLCAFKYGCLAPHQPWIRIALSRGGAAICTTSQEPTAHNCARWSA